MSSGDGMDTGSILALEPLSTIVVVFPLPIAIILLVLLMWSDVYAMANIEGRYASLDMLHAEPDLSATLLANLKAL
jgi:hypothetical protein